MGSVSASSRKKEICEKEVFTKVAKKGVILIV